MLGVNTEYAEYGTELLETIRKCGAHAAVLDHCVDEAEVAITAQLAYLRSGINNVTTRWGISATPDLLNALSGNVGERAFNRLGVTVERDPDASLHRRNPTVVGDIESEMNSRMQHWRNTEAKDHDRKSVWSMLAIRDSTIPCPRICDSKWIFLSRNTALVKIANDAWNRWLKATTRHSSSLVDRWAPISMSDKQFAGYIWTRSGNGKTSIPLARLLANCSAAVRPRADVKARAYNLMLELSGKQEADDLAALFEDREGSRALMRVTSGDPEDVTQQRLPYILEQVKLAAGEFAAARAREESSRELQKISEAHDKELERIRLEVARNAENLEQVGKDTEATRLQEQQERENLARQNARLNEALGEMEKMEYVRRTNIIQSGFEAGKLVYKRSKWLIALLFGMSVAYAAYVATDMPILSYFLTALLATAGFWFVPDLLHKPLSWMAMHEFRNFIGDKDKSIQLPSQPPDFRVEIWSAFESNQGKISSDK
jgi:hypothetical protein